MTTSTGAIAAAARWAALAPRRLQRVGALAVLGRSVPVWPAMAWVVVFMIAPLGFMFVFSFWRYSQFELYPDFTLDNYIALFDSAVYVNVLVRTVLIATFTTITTIALAYPLVIFLHRQDRRVAVFIIALIVVPFWVNTLVRNYAFFSLLQREGLINFVLGKLGFVPAEILFTTQAVLLVSVYLFLPFAIISLYASVEKISPSLLEAAEDLGAGSWQTFRRVLFPLSWSGLQVAVFFVFIPSLGLFLTPAMIGGGRTTMLSNLVVPLMAQTRNFAAGSAFVFVMLAIVLVLVMLLGRRMNLESLYAGGAGASSSRRRRKEEERLADGVHRSDSRVPLHADQPDSALLVRQELRGGVSLAGLHDAVVSGRPQGSGSQSRSEEQHLHRVPRVRHHCGDSSPRGLRSRALPVRGTGVVPGVGAHSRRRTRHRAGGGYPDPVGEARRVAVVVDHCCGACDLRTAVRLLSWSLLSSTVPVRRSRKPPTTSAPTHCKSSAMSPCP